MIKTRFPPWIVCPEIRTNDLISSDERNAMLLNQQNRFFGLPHYMNRGAAQNGFG